jgi:ABC-2 type transport system ATP-binding protein
MMIRARALGRTFGDFVAVEGVDLEVARGEIFGLLGPNGAGKTTMVRMLTGVIAPTSGTASVAGLDVATSAADVRAKVGVLTETPGLYVRLDAVENLRFFGELYEAENLEVRIREVLQLLGLWERRNDPVGGWSKGMRQRLAIARAILHRPEVVFLDEPTSALDPVSAKVVRDLIEQLRAEGRTVVLCTHNLDEAQRLCDRIGLLKRRLLRVATPSALVVGATSRARVELSEDAGSWAACVRALSFVRGVQVDGRALRVELGSLDDEVPQVVATLVGAGASLRRVVDEVRSLEDVYFELVGAEAAS